MSYLVLIVCVLVPLVSLIDGIPHHDVFNKLTGDGFVRALENRRLDLFWYHVIHEEQIAECFFNYGRYSDAFLLYSHVLDSSVTGRIEYPPRGARWFMISETRQCHDGITKQHTELTDDGLYCTDLILYNKTELTSSPIYVTVYKVSDLNLTVRLDNITRSLSVIEGFDITLDVLDGEVDTPTWFRVELGVTFPESNIITEVRQGSQVLNITNCTETKICHTNLTYLLGTGYDVIWTSVDTMIQNTPVITITQTFNYTVELPEPADKSDGLSPGGVVGIILAVLVPVVACVIVLGVHIKSKRLTVHKKYPYVKWNKSHERVEHRGMSKCTVCMMAEQNLKYEPHSPEAKAAIIQDRDEHLQRQRSERLSYYERRADAIAKPSEALSIILDAMDQSKTNIPHFEGWKLPKACDASKMLRTHVVGALVHGRATQVYLDILQWPHDSNLTINCFLQALWTETNDAESCLPPKLYIQLDNCGRENKNKFFMGMVALLVKTGVVQEATMNFLMVGHTHEDINARFSRLSQSLKKKAAKTLPELETVIKDSLKDKKKKTKKKERKIHVNRMSTVYDIRSWILPFLNPIHNHQQPHMYRFYMDRPGHVSVKYKHWSSDEDWLPGSDEDTLEIFQVDDENNQRIPAGVPQVVPPEYERNQNHVNIKHNLKGLRSFLNYAQHTWWETFFENPNEVIGDHMVWPFALFPKQGFNNIPRTVNAEASNASSTLLGLAMDKERAKKVVQMGRKRKAPMHETEDHT